MRQRVPWNSTTLHVTGNALLFLSGVILVCGIAAFFDAATSSTNWAESDAKPLLFSAALTGVLGAVMRFTTQVGDTRRSTVFSLVGFTWLTVVIVGVVPYLLAGTFVRDGASAPIVLVDAFFESVSGFSATGSTVFGTHNPIEEQSLGIMLYRQASQWVGGLGIVLLVVAVLPALRVSGLGLIDAESPGEGIGRIAPKVIDMAREFWKVYSVFTVASIVLLFAAGMGIFDAICHALSAISTGGFSTRSTSIGHFDSLSIELAIVLIMFFGATSFGLHSRLRHRKKWEFPHRYQPEFRFYVGLLGIFVLILTALLCRDGLAPLRSLRMAVFNVVTIGTTGGFGNTTGPGSDGDFAKWSAGPQFLLLLLFFIGGCTGSTAGGVKVIRIKIGSAQAVRALRSMRQPRGVFHVRYGKNVFPDLLVERIAGFIVVFGLLSILGTLTLTALGTDLLSAFTGVVGSLSNMGPALGEAGPSASFVDGYSAPARTVLAALMLVGRLEIFPMLLMLIAPYRSFRLIVPRGPIRFLRYRRTPLSD